MGTPTTDDVGLILKRDRRDAPTLLAYVLSSGLSDPAERG